MAFGPFLPGDSFIRGGGVDGTPVFLHQNFYGVFKYRGGVFEQPQMALLFF